MTTTPTTTSSALSTIAGIPAALIGYLPSWFLTASATLILLAAIDRSFTNQPMETIGSAAIARVVAWIEPPAPVKAAAKPALAPPITPASAADVEALALAIDTLGKRVGALESVKHVPAKQ